MIHQPLHKPSRLHLASGGVAWLDRASGLDSQGKKEDQVKEDQGQEQLEEETPICAVHHVAMVKQRGKYGAFWSCHERNADGSFRSYKPE